ncbi:MAG TPA: SpoIIE family protein phosphatase [Terracidiphilus sp.]|nr:SpoIIE family protein phosphatase [Terracidiphilus sp.]
MKNESPKDPRKTVLVVDDVPENLAVVSVILKETCRVLVATSGAKALELARELPHPDLILLDVMMPGMDGYKVCNLLKEDPGTNDIPVIFLTGQSETSDETHGFEVGAVDYIRKPFSPAIVQARVQTHLVLRGIREQLAQQLLTIQKELETARKIQDSILPREFPVIGGLDIAARYVPMTAVAGDFYDFIAVDDKHIGILVADVSGHGMPAALIASMLKIALAIQAPNAADPALVLSGLNSTLYGKFQHQYVTAAYVYLDMEQHRIRYAGAAHPPILYRSSPGDHVRQVLENGLFIGWFESPAYKAVELEMSAGGWCVMYTDGIPETANPSEVEFGEERFRAFLGERDWTSADQLADALLEEVSRWSGAAPGVDPEDDITMVAFRLTK